MTCTGDQLRLASSAHTHESSTRSCLDQIRPSPLLARKHRSHVLLAHTSTAHDTSLPERAIKYDVSLWLMYANEHDLYCSRSLDGTHGKLVLHTRHDTSYPHTHARTHCISRRHTLSNTARISHWHTRRHTMCSSGLCTRVSTMHLLPAHTTKYGLYLRSHT